MWSSQTFARQDGRMGCVPATVNAVMATVVMCRVRNPARTAASTLGRSATKMVNVKRL